MSDDLQWPPRDRAEMLAWQERYGDDVRVGQACGRKANTVFAMRRKFGVACVGAHPPGRAGAPIGPSDPFVGSRAKVREDKIKHLYARRNYTDVPGLR